MSSNEDTDEYQSNGSQRFQKVKQRFKDRSKKVAETKEKTKEILSKHAVIIAKQAEEHESFITKLTHFMGVFAFGGFCFILGARPQDIRYWYCFFYIIFVPLRWIYYRYKKWHYYLLDFCYYANTIFLIMLFFYPKNEKLFMVCFSFAEGPLAWALIVWRCSLVFSSVDKLVSVLIHLLPGVVFFTIRWWDPVYFEAMHPEGTAMRASWPYVGDKSFLWTWLFIVPLIAYSLWQALYFLIVDVLRRQRFLRDPEVMNSYRELSKKAQKANNMWWRLSGLLGDQNRLFMYILLQALFTVATMALTVPIFLSYELHLAFQFLKVSAIVWNGGSFLLEVMPRQVVLKEKRKQKVAQPVQENYQQDPNHETTTENAVVCKAVEEVFRDYQGRRNGLIIALTTDVERFYRQCDPEKENLCLYGFPSEQWEVNLPAEEVPPELPEPALGINFARDGMPEKDWLSLVAVHSDAWLLAVAYYFGARFGFDKADRKRLFNMINDLPTVFDVVALSSKKQPAAVSNHSSTKSKSNTKGRGSESQLKYAKMQGNDEEDELEEEEDEDEHGDTLCGACGENYASDEFWICCDICERWFHGKCVKITPARAEHIKQYKCPSCSSNKRARP